MGYRKVAKRVSLEDCLQISIKELGMFCRKSGLSLGQIVSSCTDTSSKIRGVSGTMTWSKEDKRTGERQKTGEVFISIGSDSEGVYMELSYSWKYDKETEYREKRYRYYLVAKESNLKPGTYRYYFLDPYSEEDPGLCTKLYLYRGIFYPRSILQSYGVIYKQQREGHTQRYVWTFYHRIPDYRSLKYRKSHYRGKETPIWRRYNYLCTEGDLRLAEYLAKMIPGLQEKYLEIARSTEM